MFPRDRRQPTQAGQGRGRRGLKISLLSPPAHGGERAEGPGSQPGGFSQERRKPPETPFLGKRSCGPTVKITKNRKKGAKIQKPGRGRLITIRNQHFSKMWGAKGAGGHKISAAVGRGPPFPGGRLRQFT